MSNPTKNKNQIRDRRGRFTSICSRDALGIVKSFKARQDENDVSDTIRILQAMGFSLYELQVALFAKDEGYIDPLCEQDIYYLPDNSHVILPKAREDRSGS
jgi:hypothetical protein